MSEPGTKDAGWLVSNGEQTVGPVTTQLLLRGLEHGRIDDDCVIRRSHWRTWRRLDEVREINAWRQGRAPTTAETARQLGAEWLPFATDPDELLHFAMQAALCGTGAPWGLAHRLDDDGREATTICRHAGVHALLGSKVSQEDAALVAARAGQVLAGGVDGAPAQAIAARFREQGEVRGTAMFPIVSRGHLLGFVELARSDHRVRRVDQVLLAQIAYMATTYC